MSRPIRFLGEGLIYHVMARGNNKMTIFRDDLDHERFLEILAEVVARFELDLWIQCQMPTHYHLELRTRRPNLSRAIRRLDGSFAQWWNRRHQHVGHVFQGRFKAQVVESSVYLVRLCRYVLLNPVRAGLCRHPGDWRWNSYHALTGAEPSTCVDLESLLRQIDEGDLVRTRARLIDYVNPEADPDMAAFIRSDRRVIGTAAFERRFRTRARKASREVPLRERRTGTPSLVEILAEALRAGEGLAGGIRRAYGQAHYPQTEIARCAGVSRETVRRITSGRAPVPKRPGTRQPANADLTPALPADADLTPGDPGDSGAIASGVDRGST